MKLGLYANGRKELPLGEMLAYAHGLGIQMIEIACGEESGVAHCDPKQLLADDSALAEFQEAFRRNDLEISALSCHGNPISPNKDTARLSDECMRNAVLLAEKIGLDTICCFSGCPGDHEGAKYSNWITVNWPMDYAEVYRWQWEEVLIPYWKDFASFARLHGVTRIALELHPGQMCYNPQTVKRLRRAVGDEIGVNLDFSHLLWQRMDPVTVIEEIKGFIYHMHAKDIGFQEQEIKANGYITTDFFDDRLSRPWNFRTVGYGHDMFFWKNIFAALNRAGYDYVASIEMECELMDKQQGIEKAVAFLKDALIFDEKEGSINWIKGVKESKGKLYEKYGIQE